MRPKVDLHKIRSFSDTIEDAILFYKQNFKPLVKSYFTICGIFCAAALIISALNNLHTFQLRAAHQSIFTLSYFIKLLVDLLNIMVLTLTTLSYISIYKQKNQVTPTVPEVWGYFKYYFFRFAGSYLLLSIGLVVSFLFCIVPGIYFLPIFGLVFTIMVIENSSLTYAFNRAFTLVSNNWWQPFCIMLVISLLVAAAMLLSFIPAGIIAGIVVFLTGIKTTQAIIFAYDVSTHLTAFLNIVLYIAMALIYFSLTEERDDTVLLHRIEKLGVDPAGADAVNDIEEEY